MTIEILNAFILVLGIGAACLGVSALVEKRTVRRRERAHRSTNAAA